MACLAPVAPTWLLIGLQCHVVTYRRMSHGLRTSAYSNPFPRVFHRFSPVTMASICEESIQGRIKNRLNRAFTTFLARFKKHRQSKEGGDNPYQAADIVEKTQNPNTPTPSLLSIPLEIRLQIFGHLLRADEGRICPHARLPYLFIRREIRSRYDAPNNIFLPALLINRQLYLEMKPILYSENLFYFENWLTPRNPSDSPRKLLAEIGTYIKQIGFPLDLFEIRSGFINKQASIKAAERLRAEFKMLSTHLPNLKSTRVDLFSSYKRECQRFLVCLVRSCQLLPGKKIITVHSTNRGKVRIGNILRIHLNGCSDLLILGGCICVPFTEPAWERRIVRAFESGRRQTFCSGPSLRVRIYTRHSDTGTSNSLTSWVRAGMSLSSAEKLAYESVVKYGSVFLSYTAQDKGPRMGCLLCNSGTGCVHEARYTPTRKHPVDRIGLISISTFEAWVDSEVEARKCGQGIISNYSSSYHST